MPSFRLITEGVTDQITLERILSVFYDDSNIDIEPLQPLRDRTDKQIGWGNWLNVFEYVQSVNFKEAFDFADYFIIQIDTDVSPLEGFDISHQESCVDLTPEKLFLKVKGKLISKMGEDFYDKNKTKIIFAICIHSLECWFLPLYYTDNRRNRIINCLHILNRELSTKENFTIDESNKDTKYYKRIVKRINRKKVLEEISVHNRSFQMFLESLPDK